jgi:hypothetical protein
MIVSTATDELVYWPTLSPEITITTDATAISFACLKFAMSPKLIPIRIMEIEQIDLLKTKEMFPYFFPATTESWRKGDFVCCTHAHIRATLNSHAHTP